MRSIFSVLCTVALLSACQAPLPEPATANVTRTPGKTLIKAEVWADNWFAFYLGDQFIKEDSVSITTERSFNQETFTFEAAYPLSLNFIVRDFKQDDTGLEYIGTARQQMGDGGFIAQFTNVDTGELIAVTNSAWKGLVIQQAPLDITCEKEAHPVVGKAPCTFMTLPEPDGWKRASFDDAAWASASIYTKAQVGAKDGYNKVH